MLEKTKIYKVSLLPSVMEKVKSLGSGRFAAGLAVLLAQTALNGKPVADKDTDKRPLHHTQKTKLGQAVYDARPDVIRGKIISAIKSRISVWNQHWGHLRKDTGEPVNVDDYTKYEPAPHGFDMKPGETIFNYITLEEMHTCMTKGKAAYDANMAEISVRKGTSGPHPKLSADSKHVYQNFPVLLAGLTDTQIEMMNEECDGAVERGDDPIDPPTETEN